MARESATVIRRRLGAELRRLRNEADIKLLDAGRHIGKTHGTVSAQERGEVGMSVGDVKELLELYGVQDQHLRAALVELARQSRKKDWWHSYKHVLPTWFEPFIGFEMSAGRIQTYEVQAVPGLLQTEGYARAFLEAGQQTDQVDRQVELRMERQARVLDSEDSPKIWAVLDEGVLRRPVGGRATMQQQLHHLLEKGARPNVTLQVIPFSLGVHMGMSGAFTIFRFPEPADGPKNPDVVYLEHIAGSLYKEDVDEVGRYMQVFDQLMAAGLDPAASTLLIERAAKEL